MNYYIIEKKDHIKSDMNIILPGVGSFHKLMQNLNDLNFTSSLLNCLGAIPQKKIGGNADEHIALWNVNDLISIENYGD